MNKILLLLSIVFISSQSLATEPLAVSLPNFHTVIAGQVYRGGQPSPEGIAKLAKMGIKTILNLRIEVPREMYQEKLLSEQLGMRWFTAPMTPVTYPSDVEMSYIETNILKNPGLFPIFVHCYKGEDRTGLVIALYRVFGQKPGWQPAQAYAEMLKYGFNTMFTQLSRYFFDKTRWSPPGYQGEF